MKRLLLLLSLLSVFAMPIVAQEDISPELQADFDRIESITSEVRGLVLETEIIRALPTRDDLLNFLIQTFEEELPPEELADITRFYEAFDFIEPGLDLEALVLALYQDQIAGFYDPDSKTMNVILITGDTPESELPLLEEITYSHEFIHALQDAYFDLGGIIDRLEEIDDNDQFIAGQSLFEGDATQGMTDYLLRLMQEDEDIMGELLQLGNDVGLVSMPEGTPQILQDELIFPYVNGQVFVANLIANGGWELVNEAYTNLPTSTEQIYHPEKYLAGEQPIPVSISDGVIEALGDGWEFVDSNTLGEFYLRQYLKQHLRADNVNDAATGWGGDNYVLFHNPTDGTNAWVLQTIWDDDLEATEFYEIFVEFANARFGSEWDGECWVADADSLCFQHPVPEVTWISLAPTQEQASQLINLGLDG